MAVIEIEVRGLETLAKLDPVKAHAAMVSGMRKAMLGIHASIPPYPSPPAASMYRRTGTLGRSITQEIRTEGRDILGVIGTNVEYAPYVIGREEQAWMHQGRWWTLEAEVESHVAEVGQILSDEVGRAFGI